MAYLKKSLIFLFILSGILPLNAQTKNPDKDKLIDYYETQRYTEAAGYLQSFYKEGSKDIKSLSQLAYANLMAGKLSEAEKLYQKLDELQPKSLPILSSLAVINIRRGNNDKAKTYYKEVIILDSNNFNAYKQLALLSKGNEAAERLIYLKKANLLQPTEGDVAFDLAEAYYKLNLFNESSGILETALTADSLNFRLLNIKMPLSMALNKYNDALETGQKLMKYGDSSTSVLSNLAKSYFFISDYKNALQYFLKISDMTDNENLFYNIALSYRGLKDYKNSAAYLNKSIAAGISPKIASYYGLLGESYESSGQNNEAIAAYKHGLLFDNNGSLYYNLALTYESKLNDKKNAITYYNLYLKNFKEMDKNPKLTAFIKNKIEDLKR